MIEDGLINRAMTYTLATEVGNHEVGLNPCAGTGDSCPYTGLIRALREHPYDGERIAQVTALILKIGGYFRAGKETTGCNMEGLGAGAVVLASGGAGRVFRHNVNPPSLEGDGRSMAYRAGARLVNMEFFQIGPAVFNAPLTFIIHSHMWRLRPRLTNTFGEEFLPRYCPVGIDRAEVPDLKAMSYPFSVRTDSKYLDIAHVEVTYGITKL